MKNMSDEDWDLVTLVHLKGAFSCTKACWPLFRQQKVSQSEVPALRISSDVLSTPLPLLAFMETLGSQTTLLPRVSILVKHG